MLIDDMQRIIEKRKQLWKKFKDIEKDREYREAAAQALLENSERGKKLRRQIQDHPELLIEAFFVIVDKEQQTVPFFLNTVQKELINIINRDKKLFKQGKINHMKYLLLKGRQQGMTSFINAYQLACAISKKNFSGYTLADNAENTEHIFADRGKFYFDNLPECLKPTVRYSNRREFDFSKEGRGGLNSKWRVATAGNEDAGRSKTLNFFHGSEVAFWPKLKQTLTGLEEAFTKNCIVFLETTANGYNEFKEMWDDEFSNYRKLFFEWWKTPEYRLSFESKAIEEDFKEKVLNATEETDAEQEMWALYRCKWLLETKKLDWEQLYWYYSKWKDKRETIKQEYPCTAEEAFLATGGTYFNMENVTRRLDELRELYKTRRPRKGYFIYEYGTSPWSGEKIILDDSIQFIEDNNIGYITIFNEDIEPTMPYTIGADTAGEGSDWNVGQVIDAYQNQVAIIRLQKDEDLFAEQLYCLGKFFNNALIAPEINFSTYVVRTLANREYPNIYTRENTPDAITKRLEPKLGHNTTKLTRPMLLGMLRTLVRERPECINDITTLEEMLTFVVNERGKPEAMEGYHDDCIMAYGIALYAQDQQVDEIKPPAEKLEGYYTEAELEDLGYSRWEIEQYKKGYPIYRR